MENAGVIAAIQAAIDAVEQANLQLESRLEQQITEIKANYNVLRRSIEDAQRSALTVIQAEQNAKGQVHSVIQGTTGLVANAVQLIDESEVDTTDMLRGLQRLKSEVDDAQKGVMYTAGRDVPRIASRLKSAIGHLRGYLSTQI